MPTLLAAAALGLAWWFLAAGDGETDAAYRTAPVGADGRVTYLREIYGLDRAYLRAMDTPRRPVGADTQLAAR